MLRTSIVSIALCLAATAAHAKQDPKTRTDGLVKAFIDVKSPPEDGGELTAADKQHNVKAFATLDAYFDFDTMTEMTIGPHRKKFSDEQAAHFKKVFSELIRLVAYPDSGAFLKSAKRELKKSKIKGKKADVGLYVVVEEEDLEMDVTFHWSDRGDWKLVDVSFDGAALSKDYQNQFGRIIGKAGVDGLLKKLDKRLDKEQKAQL